tara:strand:- start:49 stop:810 length:762 start_codon:yes stop_codon:yes gene_type:complete
MKKIAVCISGQLRYWNRGSIMFDSENLHNLGLEYNGETLVYSPFRDWGNSSSELEYVFFLSSWYNNEYTEEDFDFLTRYELIDPNIKKFNGNSERYTYLLQRVTDLRNSYEKENKIDFYAVINTRPDIVVGHPALEQIERICSRKNHECISQLLVYTKDGISVNVSIDHLNRRIDNLFTDDTFTMGHPTTMDKFGRLYTYVYIDNKILTRQLHKMNSEFFINHGLANRQISDGPYDIGVIGRGHFKVFLNQEL